MGRRGICHSYVDPLPWQTGGMKLKTDADLFPSHQNPQMNFYKNVFVLINQKSGEGVHMLVSGICSVKRGVSFSSTLQGKK